MIHDIVIAARLADDLDSQRRREDDAFAEGFRLGYEDGFDVGYRRAHQEMADAWRVVYEAVQRAAKMPTFEEIQRARKAGE